LIADVVVVGAGPVGLAVAIETARRGLAVSVLERGMPPLDKVCGEGVLPLGVVALERLGVSFGRADAALLHGIRYVSGACTAEGRFERGPGLGIRRAVLASALSTRARSLGVALRYGTRVTGFRDVQRRGAAAIRVETDGGSLLARVLVAADGLHSGIRRSAGLELPARGPIRVGLRRHYACRPWSSLVEVHWADALEAYVTPVAPGLVSVALLCRSDRLGAGGYDALLAQFPDLASRVKGVPVLGSERGAARFRQRVRARHRGRVVLVGDAAGSVDPLTGEGLTLGFRSAHALAEVLAENAPLARYERRAQALYRRYELGAKGLLALSARPSLRQRAIEMLAEAPDLFTRFLALSAGETPLASFGIKSVARACVGMLRRRSDVAPTVGSA
jgi:flavin-dependent dehydrogenase